MKENQVDDMQEEVIAIGYGPASIGNFSVAFDVLGVGLEQPGDIIRAEKTSTKKSVDITSITGDSGRLSKDPRVNTAGVATMSLLSAVDADFGVSLSLRKGIPLGSGLGSSASSATAALIAVNSLLDSPLSKNDLIPFAIEAEYSACGARHGDNVAPSLLGGVVLITSYDPLRVYKLPLSSSLWVSTITPHIEVETSKARSVLPKEVPISSVSKQLGLMGGALLGLFQNDPLLIEQHLVDILIEPHRDQFIPHFKNHKQKALESGAIAFGISGAGPTVFALSKDKNDANLVSIAVSKSFLEYEITSTISISPLLSQGARLLDKRMADDFVNSPLLEKV